MLARENSGQVMLITVLVLSGVILGATTIAGLLMLYQIRQAGDIVSSTEAVYAADSGIEWRLYKFFKINDLVCNPDPACPDSAPGDDVCVLNNDATFETTCDSASNGTEIITIKSKGNSGQTFRAFETQLERAAPAQ